MGEIFFATFIARIYSQLRDYHALLFVTTNTLMNRYIEIDAYNINIGSTPRYVPFWDYTNLNYSIEDDEYSQVTVAAGFHDLRSEKVIWDLLAQKVVDPIEITVKLPLAYLKCEIGEILAYEAAHRELRISKLTSISHDNGYVETTLQRGKYLTPREREAIGDNVIDNQLYMVKEISPVFTFEDGTVIRSEHMIYKLV